MSKSTVFRTDHVEAQVIANPCQGASEQQQRQHLIVLQHGYFGIASLEWPYTRHALLALEKSRNLLPGSLVILLSNVAPALRSNRGRIGCMLQYKLPLDALAPGIDLAGELLCDLIIQKSAPHTACISFIGHSMGGLIARYCIGKLYAHGYFKNVQPVNFVTLSTPHLGALITRRSSRYYSCLNRSGAFAGPRYAAAADGGGKEFIFSEKYNFVCVMISYACFWGRYQATHGTSHILTVAAKWRCKTPFTTAAACLST